MKTQSPVIYKDLKIISDNCDKWTTFVLWDTRLFFVNFHLIHFKASNYAVNRYKVHL